jgi:hypothetical protein
MYKIITERLASLRNAPDADPMREPTVENISNRRTTKAAVRNSHNLMGIRETIFSQAELTIVSSTPCRQPVGGAECLAPKYALSMVVGRFAVGYPIKAGACPHGGIFRRATVQPKKRHLHALASTQDTSTGRTFTGEEETHRSCGRLAAVRWARRSYS